MYQTWESCKPIYSFKGHSGDCGEWILEVSVLIEKKAGIQTRGDDDDLRYALEMDPEGLADKLNMRGDGGRQMGRGIKNTSYELD